MARIWTEGMTPMVDNCAQVLVSLVGFSAPQHLRSQCHDDFMGGGGHLLHCTYVKGSLFPSVKFMHPLFISPSLLPSSLGDGWL